MLADRMAELRDMAADIFTVEPEEVERATTFSDDLGVDSLLAVELLSRIEQRYNIMIDADDLQKMTDLRSTYKVVADAAGW
ncbi:acyl carrier protein [Streptomyces sp. NBC_00878]|uniref:acyl carrier protein n=1 Tax=Streptomyces sp. NBC_00878 TaxID=2975854 RepID=UPI00224FC55C|nr:acyl carrier protein [Streptomyces sp. NBC_00878]MCX4904339.1 acyl carrier protein [Streptomyces sp. NBC_00878]